MKSSRSVTQEEAVAAGECGAVWAPFGVPEGICREPAGHYPATEHRLGGMRR